MDRIINNVYKCFAKLKDGNKIYKRRGEIRIILKHFINFPCKIREINKWGVKISCGREGVCKNHEKIDAPPPICCEPESIYVCIFTCTWQFMYVTS